MDRIKYTIKTSLVGVFVNFLLVIFKFFVGFLSGSISIFMDGINNLCDVLSCLATIIGIYFAGKGPDKEHPYGHGMIEYFVSFVISLFIVFTGFSCFYESFKKIIHPVILNYSYFIIFVILIGVVVKLLLGRYFIHSGRKINSNVLIASGKDALFDSIITFTTFIGAITSLFLNINIDGYLGIIISFFVIKSGFSILSDSFKYIIGIDAPNGLKSSIKNKINSYNDVLGSHDLILHQYGPDKIIGSIYIEVNDRMTAKKIHRLTQQMYRDILDNFGVILTIGIYASNKGKSEYNLIRKYIEKVISKYDNIINYHGYYVDNYLMLITFDLTFNFSEENSDRITKLIIAKLEKRFPKYKFSVKIDLENCL